MYVLCLQARRRSANHTKSCGSGLAREGGVSVNINADCHDAFASKPAPTLDSDCLLVFALPDKTAQPLFLRVEVIQRPIHRQLTQHDDLRNPQQRVAMRAFQKSRKVTGHDAGRCQGFARVGQ